MRYGLMAVLDIDFDQASMKRELSWVWADWWKLGTFMVVLSQSHGKFKKDNDTHAC